MTESQKGEDETEFSIEIERLDDYQFIVNFDKKDMGELITDETKDVGGEEEGPNPSRLLAASTLNCLLSSLLFCSGKKRVDIESMRGKMTGKTERIDGRLRITQLKAEIELEVENKKEEEKLSRCIEIFEDYCVVTQSVRRGIDIDVKVGVES